MSALAFVGLGARANELISSFSYGHQRLIEIARALAANPTLLLLDEPAAGLNSSEKIALHALLKRIAAQGLTILIIDHDMTLVSEAAAAHHGAQFRPPHCRRRIAGGAAPSRRRLRLSRKRIMALLQINDLIVRYGEIEALRGVSLAVDEGQVVTLLGANGAGKSTTLRAISGLIKPASGEILFDGNPIAGLARKRSCGSASRTCRKGGGYFPGLSVQRKHHARRLEPPRSAKPSCRARPTRCSTCFRTSARFADALGWTLSGGQQQMVAVARGLMAKPRLLLLDEPSLGLAPVIVQAVFRIIAEIRRSTTVLLVEQNARMGLVGRRPRLRARDRAARARRQARRALGQRRDPRRLSRRPCQGQRVSLRLRQTKRVNDMVTIQLSNLIDFVADIFGHADSSPEEARRIATYLTTANLTGHDSHGVIRIPVYMRWKKMGSVVPNQTAEIVVDTPSLAVVDGKFGYGQTVAPVAVKIGIEKCKKAGLAAVALRNAGHIGRVGDWAEMAAAEGLVSVHFVNAAGSLLVAPYGGVEKRLSTAPYCVGVPREGQDPIVLDFATSIVAEGKCLVASRGGKKLPKGALIDGDGS